ncbi:hypothetical protein DY000_02025470 [Brassica cretica]|uniref:Uncharacterized protein n=1 Tax=Brassica cretica TaxID=69181 RepID=A0ABQ7E7J4_BRACR|nr:hypothetical protein DY000_02025470 [Brassica cretica]
MVIVKALTAAGEGTMYSHIKPRFLWKLQRWMGLGIDKKMVEASGVFDRVCAEYISAKREEVKLQRMRERHHYLGTSLGSSGFSQKTLTKIRREINKNPPNSKTGHDETFDPNELNKLVLIKRI